MNRLPALIAGVLLLASRSLLAGTTEDAAAKAHLALRAGVVAHIEGDDAAAQRRWTQCRNLAATGSDDESTCRLYAEIFGRARARDKAENTPAALKAYRDGVAAYRRDDNEQASRRWHDCIGAAKAGSRVMHDCLAALELVGVYGDSEKGASQAYFEGLIHFQKGDAAGARESWKRCLTLAPSDDCRAGLAKLDSAASTAPDAKK